MIIHESRSAEHWCPFGRKLMGDTEIGAAAGNRDGRDRPEVVSPCIGSDCMAWRWAYVSGPIGDPVTSDTRGFCGLAGSPTP